MTDEEIIDLFFERSEQAISELAEKHGNAVKRVAFNILGDLEDTKECVNDTYMALWESIPPTIPKSLKAYTCKLVRFISISKARHNSSKKRNASFTESLDDLLNCISSESEYTVDNEIQAKELGQIISCFLETLKKEDRVIFVLRYFYGESPESIAKRFSTSSHTISNKLYRTKNRLREYLIKEGYML